jgi:glycosyltransferase involved in cell wall biosynthesis
VRLLYLHYGPQSGVTAAVTGALAAAGLDVALANPTERFLWRLRPGSRIPNPRPAALRAFAEALRLHGRCWKDYWVHTPWAFDHLSGVAGEAIRRGGPDAVLQAGVLFGPGAPDRPYHLYVDHTRAIAERYEPAAGLPRPLPPDPAWRAREERVYRGATTIFSMSAFAARSLVLDYGVDPERVRVVGAGPNIAPVAPPASFPESREPAILFVGRSFAPKGGPDLVEAFRRVRRVHRRAALWIVSQQAPASLPDGAVFHGPLEPHALAALFARASAFCLPTLREAFGLVFLEAMAFGLPVVATAVEAVPEIVVQGETGLLVPPRDPAALAAACAALLADPARARRLGEAGRARVAERFGWDRAAARMLEVLRPVSRGASGGERGLAPGRDLSVPGLVASDLGAEAG